MGERVKIKQRIGLVGVGNMGSAILEGALTQKFVTPSQIVVYDKLATKATRFAKKWKVRRSASVEDLLKRTQVLILAFKPQDLKEAAPVFKKYLKKNHVVISILAGTPLAKIKRLTGARSQCVRAMPNLGAKVGEAVTSLTSTSRSSLHIAEKIFSGCGKTVRLSERHFDLVTAISGSGPAYFFLLMELLSGIGSKHGLHKKTAELLAVQTAVGASLLAQSSAFAPGELRKMVTSKKGTTEAALNVLFKKKFPSTFQMAVEAALKRGRQLSRT